MPKVSVIIPAFNAVTFLPDSVQSIAAQTFQDYEMIIVNDGSTDQTEAWLAQITDSRIKLISQTNQGTARARNAGIAQAQGEYIALLDADDRWEATKLEKQVKLLDQDPRIGLVYTWVAVIDRHGNPTGKICKNNLAGDVWENLIEHNAIESCSAPLIRRQCFEQVGYFDPEISQGSCGSEDWDMWLRIAEHYPFGVVAEPLTYYRDHAQNASKDWAIMAQGDTLILDKIFANAPPHRQHLQSRSYGFAYLRAAWKALQNLQGDCDISLGYRHQAIAAYPALRYSRDYLRLSLALFLVQAFGLDRYNQFRDAVYRLKSALSPFALRAVPNHSATNKE
jgi:glycosyltransferase involved in cell wall biosynthesis